MAQELWEKAFPALLKSISKENSDVSCAGGSTATSKQECLVFSDISSKLVIPYPCVLYCTYTHLYLYYVIYSLYKYQKPTQNMLLGMVEYSVCYSATCPFCSRTTYCSYL